jgi:hypothetical protein
MRSACVGLAGSVNQGLQLHDRAEKRRQANPAEASVLYREAIAAYQVHCEGVAEPMCALQREPGFCSRPSAGR